MLPRDGQMAPSPSQIHTAGDSADFCSLHAGQPLCRVDDVMVPPERRNRTSGFKKNIYAHHKFWEPCDRFVIGTHYKCALAILIIGISRRRMSGRMAGGHQCSVCVCVHACPQVHTCE